MIPYTQRNSRTELHYASLHGNPNKVGFIRAKLSDCNGSDIPVLPENGREIITLVFRVNHNKSLFVVKYGTPQESLDNLNARNTQLMVLNFLERNNNLISYWDDSSILFITSHQITANNLAELLQVAHLSESTMSGERCLELTR